MNYLFEKLASYLYVASIMLIIVITSVQLVAFNEGYYSQKFTVLGVYDALSGYDVDSINNDVLQYLQFEKDAVLIENNFFAEREKQHLLDVKNLIHALLFIRMLSFILLFSILLYFAFVVKKKEMLIRDLLRLTAMSCFILFCVVLLFIVIALLSFSIAFDVFHKLFFYGDSYLFNASIEKIVVLYPEQLFFDLFVLVLCYIVFSTVFFFLFCVLFLKYFFTDSFFIFLFKKIRR